MLLTVTDYRMIVIDAMCGEEGGVDEVVPFCHQWRPVFFIIRSLLFVCCALSRVNTCIKTTPLKSSCMLFVPVHVWYIH